MDLGFPPGKSTLFGPRCRASAMHTMHRYVASQPIFSPHDPSSLPQRNETMVRLVAAKPPATAVPRSPGIGPLVHRVAGMAAHPAPVDLVRAPRRPAGAATGPCSPPDRRRRCASSAAPSPVPAGDAVAHVFAVGVQHDAARALQRLQRRRPPRSVPCGCWWSSGSAPDSSRSMTAKAQDRRPAARPGVGLAAAIGPDLDHLGRRLAGVPLAQMP